MSPPTRIIDNLYLGDYSNATNLLHPKIKELNVRHIINCCKGAQNCFPNNFNYINLDWIDNETQNINYGNELINVITCIDNALNKDEAVFVHCGAGVSRSATVIIAYLMFKFAWDYDAAYIFVKAKRSSIQPNTNFEKQLRHLF